MTSARTRISVIIPVFQDASGLASCLQGLVRQTVPLDEFETIVVDNGSDPPIELPGVDLSRLTVLRCLTPGSYAARNAGALTAQGDILAFTDADCVPDPQWLEIGSRALEATDRDVIVGGEVKFIDPARPTAVSLYQTITGFQQSENIAEKGFSATANIFCRRDTLQHIGPFSESLLSGGDREWAWRAARAGIPTIFEANSVVRTLPRMSLGGALRQARRVAAGRLHLRRFGLAEGRLESLHPHRGVAASFRWILSRRELSWRDRFAVLWVACIIKSVSIIESIRIRLGGGAERR